MNYAPVTSDRTSSICAATSVADAVRRCLGPRGMLKKMEAADGEIITANNGATILKQMFDIHPTARRLVELSKAQDIEAGDGTTSVVILAESLLIEAEKMLNIGIHPTTISDSFQRAAAHAMQVLEEMSTPVDLENDEELASIFFTSRVVSQFSEFLASLAVKAVKRIIDPKYPNNVNLNMIKLVKKLGETVEESELIDGALIEQKSMGHGGPSRIEKAKIGLIQFHITDFENQVDSTYCTQICTAFRCNDKRAVVLCEQIKKAGCNVLLIQKSLQLDVVTEKALQFFSENRIMVVKDVELKDFEFYSRIFGCRPVASVDYFVPEVLGSADLVEKNNDKSVIKFTGVRNPGQVISILLCGANNQIADKVYRSFEKALNAIRCLVKNRALLPGGGAPEMEVAVKLRQAGFLKKGWFSKKKAWLAFADAMELIPYTLAENAGLSPTETVTELRRQHANGNKDFGINVRKGAVTNIKEENVLQPLLVTSYAIKQASETVRSILKFNEVRNHCVIECSSKIRVIGTLLYAIIVLFVLLFMLILKLSE